MSIPLAFYGPLKDPDHPVPSGDRAMARLLLRGLALAGFAPTVASTLRTFEPAGDAAHQAGLRDAGRAEATRLLALYRSAPAAARPRLWFTYHCYYKAPDWTGPAVAAGLGIPYVIAEGSRAGKRSQGAWALAHRGAEAALDHAGTLFALTSRDAAGLRRSAPVGQRIVDLPPFLDAAEWPRRPAAAGRGRDGPLRLLAVAMMREGDKLASYRLLADALLRLPEGDPAWILDIVGDGPARPEVAASFARLSALVRLHGAVEDRSRLAAFYADADLLVWPAVNEAYGMVLLEAQAMGCPVLAGRCGGVPDVVRDGVTGLLAPAGDPDSFAALLAGILAAPGRLGPMRDAASDFVRRERSLAGAAEILGRALGPLVAVPRAA